MRGIVSPVVQYPEQPLKSETSRTAVPIPESLALDLSAHVAQWRAETVLTNEWGKQLAPWCLERAMRSARTKVPGLPDGFRYHDLRHYFASLLIASGSDVKVVHARLRHASAKTTLDCYGHLWPDFDDSTRAAVEAVFSARVAGGRRDCARRKSEDGRDVSGICGCHDPDARSLLRAFVVDSSLGEEHGAAGDGCARHHATKRCCPGMAPSNAPKAGYGIDSLQVEVADVCECSDFMPSARRHATCCPLRRGTESPQSQTSSSRLRQPKRPARLTPAQAAMEADVV